MKVFIIQLHQHYCSSKVRLFIRPLQHQDEGIYYSTAPALLQEQGEIIYSTTAASR
jgi:hypothetical protein